VNFSLTDDQREIRALAREVAEAERPTRDDELHDAERRVHPGRPRRVGVRRGRRRGDDGMVGHGGDGAGAHGARATLLAAAFFRQNTDPPADRRAQPPR
jgi:hypothetical protein